MVVKIVVLALAAVAALYGLHRVALWAERRGWIYYLHRQGSSSTVGNAFLELQTMLEPGKKYILEVKRKERVVEDESGDPPVPGQDTQTP